jgi:hypothetical protein
MVAIIRDAQRNTKTYSRWNHRNAKTFTLFEVLMTSKYVDLTGGFTELAFKGFVEIFEDERACNYRFIDFVVEFRAPRHKDYTKTIQLESLGISGFAPGGGRCIFEGWPLAVEFSTPGDVATISNAIFSFAKQKILDAEYVAFGLWGTRVKEIHDPTLARITGERKVDRCVWPVAAKGNQIKDENRSRFAMPKYRTPADPNDCCAPEKIR